jgi:hypothetical protein
MEYASAELLPGTGRAGAPDGTADAPDIPESLLRMAQDFEDIAYDLETGAVDVRHIELLPQRSRDG